MQRDIFSRLFLLCCVSRAQFINIADQHQEICHAGSRIIKYFHLCAMCTLKEYAYADT